MGWRRTEVLPSRDSFIELRLVLLVAGACLLAGLLGPAAPAASPVASPRDDGALGPPDFSPAFTPWMNGAELQNFLNQYDTMPPGGHPNFWDKGHWINRVEGRWANGETAFRLSFGPVPPHQHLWWYWYYGVDETFFNNRAADLDVAGFTLVCSNSFMDADGQVRYQGVWHKVIR